LDTLELKTLAHQPAVERDKLLKWVVAQNKAGKHEIGFLSFQALEERVFSGRLAVMLRNNDPVAFVLWGGDRHRLKILQHWVRPDARIMQHGRLLTGALARRACERHQRLLSLWCLQRIAATYFWSALGFQPTNVRTKSTRANREQIQWQCVASNFLRSPFEANGAVLAPSEPPTSPFPPPPLAWADPQARQPLRELFE
jgi:hypothetical protein